MPLLFLLDEHIPSALWTALQQHNAKGLNPLDVVRVGDPPNLPKGTPDPDILRWAEREGRILVSFDRKTLPGHLSAHLLAGNHCPGILIADKHAKIPDVVSYLETAAYATDAADWEDRLESIP